MPRGNGKKVILLFLLVLATLRAQKHFEKLRSLHDASNGSGSSWNRRVGTHAVALPFSPVFVSATDPGSEALGRWELPSSNQAWTSADGYEQSLSPTGDALDAIEQDPSLIETSANPLGFGPNFGGGYNGITGTTPLRPYDYETDPYTWKQPTYWLPPPWDPTTPDYSYPYIGRYHLTSPIPVDPETGYPLVGIGSVVYSYRKNEDELKRKQQELVNQQTNAILSFVSRILAGASNVNLAPIMGAFGAGRKGVLQPRSSNVLSGTLESQLSQEVGNDSASRTAKLSNALQILAGFLEADEDTIKSSLKVLSTPALDKIIELSNLSTQIQGRAGSLDEEPSNVSAKAQRSENGSHEVGQSGSKVDEAQNKLQSSAEIEVSKYKKDGRTWGKQRLLEAILALPPTYSDLYIRPGTRVGGQVIPSGRIGGWGFAYDMRGIQPGAVTNYGSWYPLFYPYMTGSTFTYTPPPPPTVHKVPYGGNTEFGDFQNGFQQTTGEYLPVDTSGQPQPDQYTAITQNFPVAGASKSETLTESQGRLL